MDDKTWLANQVIDGLKSSISNSKSPIYTINLDDFLQQSDYIPKTLLCDPKDWLNDSDIKKLGFANFTPSDDEYGEVDVKHELFDFSIYYEDEDKKLVFIEQLSGGYPDHDAAISAYTRNNSVIEGTVLHADCDDENYYYKSSRSNVILKSEMNKIFPHTGFFRNFDKLSISESMHSTDNTETINAALATYSVYTPFIPTQQEDGSTPNNYPEFVNSVDIGSVKDYSKFDLQFFASSASDQVSVEGSPLQLKIVSDAILNFASEPDYLLVKAAKGFNQNYNRVFNLPEDSTDFADEHKEILGIQVDTNKIINIIKSEDCTTPIYELFAESQYNIHNVKKLFDKANELSSTDEQLQVVAIELMSDIESIMESDANFTVDQIKDEFSKVWNLDENNNNNINTI
jgi:hypothetical protein